MILVDKDIKELQEEKKIISNGYTENNVNSISYDLTIDYICNENNSISYELQPMNTIFIKTNEEINIPDNIMGRIGEKNSRMREGLIVNGPHYYPGHKTFIFLRVQNISKNVICLRNGMNIAQIIFEELKQTPTSTYNGTFQNEKDYKGLGEYNSEYESEIKSTVDNAKNEINNIAHSIYFNVLVLMGILVSLFSVISINYQAFTQATISIKFIIVLNLTLALCICLIMGLIMIIVNCKDKKNFIRHYTIAIILLLLTCILITILL